MWLYVIFFIELNLFLLSVLLMFRLYINIRETIELKKPIKNKFLCFIGIHDWIIYTGRVKNIYEKMCYTNYVSARKCSVCNKNQYFKNNKYVNY